MRDLSEFFQQYDSAADDTLVMLSGPLFMDITFSGLSSLPTLGQEIWSKSLQYSPGGIANQAIACARLGMRTEICSFIGDDFVGKLCEHELTKAKVGLAYSQHTAQQNLTVALPYQEERALISYGSPSVPPLPSLTTPPDFVAIGLSDVNTNLPLIQSWRNNGTKVIADIGWQDTQNPELCTRVGDVDIFVPNAEEACLLSGCPNPALAAKKLASAGTDVLVTLGNEGAYAHLSNGNTFSVPAPQVTVKDTTGAGDTFTAGLICALSANLDLLPATNLATHAASLQASRAGSSVATPTFQELKIFYQKMTQ